MKSLKSLRKQSIKAADLSFKSGVLNESIAKKFINKLKVDLKSDTVSIIEVDETLSSNSAKELMIDLGMGEKSRQKEDAYAAVIILQNFLDSLV